MLQRQPPSPPSHTAGSPTHIIASVVGLGAGSNTFETRLLINMTWTAAAPSSTSATLTVTDYRQVAMGYARIRIPLATIPAAVTAGTIRQPAGTTGQLRYSVYIHDKANTTEANMRSRCGLSRAMLVQTAVGLTSGTSSVDIKLPQSSHRYTVSVLVDHVWRSTVGGRPQYEASSPAYLVYTAASELRGGTQQPDDDSSSSSSGMPLPPAPESGSSGLSPVVIAVIAIAAVAVLMLAAMGIMRYHKQKQLASGSDMLMGRVRQQALVTAGRQLCCTTAATAAHRRGFLRYAASVRRCCQRAHTRSARGCSSSQH